MEKELEKSINELKKCSDELRKFNKNGLEQFVYEDESLSFPEELGETVKNFIGNLNFISNQIDISDIINELCEEKEEKFWDIIKEYIDTRVKTVKETSFLIKLNDKSFKELIECIFLNYILERDNIEIEGYSEQQINIVIKFVNTCIHMIIEDLFSKKMFDTIASEMFRLEQSKIDYIWELINKYKNDLRYIAIMSKLNSLEERLQ